MGATWGDRMEVACVRAGVWRVEGFDVERITQGDRKGWWQVLRRRAEEPTYHYGNRPTLTEAVALVDEIKSGDTRCPVCRIRDDHEPDDAYCRTMQAERDLKNRED